jgi:hypothetical protein
MVLNHIKIVFFTFLSLFLGCQTKTAEKDGSRSSNEQKNLSFQHFGFVDSKVEKRGSNVNTMELYCILDKYDLDELQKLCLDKKESFKNGTFYFLVIFDKKENAAFPSTPFTAAYGTDDELMKHIKALYTYNSVNGHSVLATYDKNMLQSIVKEINL